MAPKREQWHKHQADILREHLPVMSGKNILETGSELEQTFRVDFYCRVGPGTPERVPKQGIFIFDHLLEYNIFEYKSIHEGLNRVLFEEYLARALLFRTRKEKDGLFNRLTLNILLTRMPRDLFKREEYRFVEMTPWKYRTEILGLPVYILIQKKTRGVKGGEPMAWFQVLEGDPRYQKSTWQGILSQENFDGEGLRKVMLKLNEEAYMSIVEVIIEEARPKIIKDARHQIINEARSSIIDEARPRIIDEARPKIINEARPSIIDEARPKIIDEARPKIIDEARPKIIDEARPKIIDEARPSIIDEARPRIIDEARPKIINEARPSIIDEARPSIIDEARPKIINEARPSIIAQTVLDLLKSKPDLFDRYAPSLKNARTDEEVSALLERIKIDLFP